MRGGFRQFLGGLLVERIGGGHENGLAHAVERKHAPSPADFGRKSPRQFNVDIVLFQREKGGAGFVRENFQGFFHGQDSFAAERMNERFDHAIGRRGQIGRNPAQLKIGGGDDFTFNKNLVHGL